MPAISLSGKPIIRTWESEDPGTETSWKDRLWLQKTRGGGLFKRVDHGKQAQSRRGAVLMFVGGRGVSRRGFHTGTVSEEADVGTEVRGEWRRAYTVGMCVV